MSSRDQGALRRFAGTKTGKLIIGFNVVWLAGTPLHYGFAAPVRKLFGVKDHGLEDKTGWMYHGETEVGEQSMPRTPIPPKPTDWQSARDVRSTTLDSGDPGL